MLGCAAIHHEHAVGAEDRQDVRARAGDQQESVGEFGDSERTGRGLRMGWRQEGTLRHCNASCGGPEETEKAATIRPGDHW